MSTLDKSAGRSSPRRPLRGIAAELECEQAPIEANLELIRWFEGKNRAAIERVWGKFRLRIARMPMINRKILVWANEAAHR